MGKTYFVIPTPNMTAAAQAILQYLSSQGFTLLGQYDIVLNGVNLRMTGYKCQSPLAASFVEYAIYNNNIYMYAYVNSPEFPIAIDDKGLFGGLAKTDGIHKIMPLVQMLQNVADQNNSQSRMIQNQNTNSQQIVNMSDTLSSYSWISLILSIGTLILSCVGFGVSFFLIAFGAYIAALAIKYSQKKGMAITAIVLLAISLIVSIVQYIR